MSTARRRSQAARRRRQEDKAGRLINERQRSYAADHDDPNGQMRTGRLYRRDDVSMRRVRPSEYTDDLRYDDHASPYAPASTLSGRRSSRNIANIERPNVTRRRPRSGSGGRRPPRRPGLMGYVEGFLSDPRRALFLLIVLLAVVLTAILVFSVSSCVSGKTQGTTPQQVVPVGSTTGQTDDESNPDAEDDSATTDDQQDETSDQDAEGAGADDQQDANTEQDGSADQPDDAEGETTPDEEPAAPEKTIIDVSVASGEVSWVEITCDGASEVAQSVTGPWSRSYTVHDSITIQVDNTDAVTITDNGERVELSSHAGGLGSVTLDGTPLPEEEADQGETADGEEAQGETSGDATIG